MLLSGSHVFRFAAAAGAGAVVSEKPTSFRAPAQTNITGTYIHSLIHSFIHIYRTVMWKLESL